MALTQSQRAAAELIRSRLDPKHPLFSGSKEIEAALTDLNLRVYLEAWVLPMADFLLGAEGAPDRSVVMQDLGSRSAAAYARAQYIDYQAAKKTGA